MSRFSSFKQLRAACLDLPAPDQSAADAAAAREAQLTKPPGSLGRLEELTAWLAAWQGRNPPTLDNCEILIFAGNHGVAGQGVSAYPPEVTGQMVANFTAGGAAINQLARANGARLRVTPLDLDRPTADFTEAPAMDEAEFLEAVGTGYDQVSDDADLIVLGEMGIGNTTAAAALSGALFGGGARFASTGTGVGRDGFGRKRAVIQQALLYHSDVLGDPLRAAAAVGGRELAAMMGACLAARHKRTPVLIDGMVSSTAVAPLKALRDDALDHARVGHKSADAGHESLLQELGMRPLLDLGMRLGEGTGASVALLVLRAALVCHTGMATFEEAHVSGKSTS
ncbi:nicotinate-nucleotide--dimethylbenzimidazole phosphoribosyltransferase [Methyloceanibacter methanicus]|uniref:Nicotinate-nucleotide--dimethylbenzimidazole phosphoribosyltransferase n=1 Tax=Methyloceanibacter methanicus TaxID=1774968 RepID=A0A1E3W5L9_9HYPH|nr:nicotinate-nucleotide--dimethylbenzimidazole phosphoribosyltransferase [Methyloceanibacter methanicus]ODS01109.1 nicotinate-nucleotide--dimethylbenzimidazole phosphoribosyltransferase [Methyloceanibacter methanicus]